MDNIRKRIESYVHVFAYICIDVGDPVIMMVGCDPLSQFNPSTFVYMSQTRTWISNFIYRGLFVVSEFRSNSGGGILIYLKNDISIIRKSELENNLDETIWVEIRSKGQSFFYYETHIDLRVQILITGHD
jgi:hypothetical protein